MAFIVPGMDTSDQASHFAFSSETLEGERKSVIDGVTGSEPLASQHLSKQVSRRQSHGGDTEKGTRESGHTEEKSG